jgi:hypothetical protein
LQSLVNYDRASFLFPSIFKEITQRFSLLIYGFAIFFFICTFVISPYRVKLVAIEEEEDSNVLNSFALPFKPDTGSKMI